MLQWGFQRVAFGVVYRLPFQELCEEEEEVGGKIRIRKLHEHLAEELDLVMIYHNCFQIVLSLIIYHCSSNADYDCIFIFQENLIPSEWRTTLEKVGVRVMMNGETND